ncbi:reverse transcriptase-like protein [Aquibacillus salsiterrae]|uniref:Reverse transcriptase-like protein n=1 Tax=Aquibacillus salsiterrae TaxID=2950439 RepID=A0A9X4AEM7_9BACI|nr:reverse transcriptase-like protein [Aquibacillus salsiterrae]MDC3415330.1 reverse transcriptase-like protein [Aquibacillus salsiterrae]
MLEVYTDGASSGDPGPSGAGIYIKSKQEEYSIRLGSMSNHEAELWAIIKALEICTENYPDEILSFRSDSKLAVDLIEKEFTKNQKFLPLLDNILTLSKAFPFFFIKWIPEKQNKTADVLARKAIHH